MTDEPAPVDAPAPDPARDRARIDALSGAKKTDLLPILYLVGFLALAGAMYFLWQNPPESRLAAQDAGRVDTLQTQVAALRETVARLEQQKPPPAGPSVGDFQQLQAQVAALASKPAANEAEVQQLQQQLQAMAARPGVTPDQLAQQVQGLVKQEPNLEPLTQRIDALEKRPPFDPASLDGKFGQINDKLQQFASKNDDAGAKLGQSLKDVQARIDGLDKQQQTITQQQQTITQRAQLATKLQGVATALAAGQKLGPIPGAPPALARFSGEAPPTEASLRESFDRYASAAQSANQPATSQNQDFMSRLWTRAQTSVTVRQGDQVLVGDPIAGILAHAREQLDNGDLAGSVETLKALGGPAARAMQPWTERAAALLDARTAIAGMVAG